MLSEGRRVAILGAAVGVRFRRAVAVIGVLLLTACTSSSPPATPTPPPPTAAPVVVATAAPTALPTAIPPAPTPTAAAAQAPLYVTNMGRDGLTLRRTPGGERIDVLTDGAAVTPTGEEQQADGRAWRKVRDSQGREGWLAAEFLTAEAPGPPTAAAAAPNAAPTSAVAATATPPSAQATPTAAAAVPAAPPAILTQPTPKPEAPTAAPKPVPAAAKPAASGNCHPSYPDFCIPPPPPDVNCTSAVIAGRKNFRVTGPDVHRLDQGGRPGIACES